MSTQRKPSLGKRITPYVLVTPVFIYYLIFWVQPVLQQVVRSFIDPATGQLSLESYRLVLADPDFIPALRNTAIIVVISVTLEFFIALFLALIIKRDFRGASIFLFLAMLPMALPPVAVGAMWKTGLTTNGWLNSLLHYVGFLPEGEKIYWLAGSTWKMLALIIVIDAWQVIPSVMIILLAGLQNIPKELEEAGYVFGGNYFTVLRKITLPLLRPTIQTAVVLRLIAAIQIWLIVIVLVGFSRLPVLVERIVYYHEEVPRLNISPQMAAGYTMIVTVIVSTAALIYLRLSGAFRRGEGG
ncbi:MAG TPA: sugar ABC transporter permease [Anaerolineales bacterium]|nr:sugar ABC transporter permease [Anaerolineae bacterium]HIP88304.1 sugar ABC transporter permease [Anaerolineales bacterium]